MSSTRLADGLVTRAARPRSGPVHALALLANMAASAVALSARAQDGGLPDGALVLPGTQPNTLTKELRSPTLCRGCHGDHASYASYDTWKGTMMANAARDPLFHAALAIANQDIPGSGEICIRCHSPPAWLFGRSEQPSISNLLPDDFESVQCDFCHRLKLGPSGAPTIGTGQYFVADDFVRRGPIQDAAAPHDWQYSAYHESSELCGLCHDVSNPLRGGFAIERTYSEWKASAFGRQGKTCQSCHLPAETGKACGAPGMPDRDVHRHELAGGNTWMPGVLAGEHPELDRADAYAATQDNARRMLRSAATLRVQAPAAVEAGQRLAFTVRVENLAGHKLPTGYPEGRRSWLEVVVTDTRGAELLRSGGYDSVSATRSDDAQLRTYEVRMAAGGVEGFHFIVQDELLQDNRIPPRGFVAAADTRPVGRTYPTLAPGDSGQSELASWDDAPYELSIPGDAEGPLRVSATLWYQTTSREYVTSLRDANQTDDAGRRMLELWERHGRAEPVAMAEATSWVELPRAEVDAGTDGAEDASLDAASDISTAPQLEPVGGCSCRSGRGRAQMSLRLLLLPLLIAAGRLRRRGTKEQSRCEPGTG